MHLNVCLDERLGQVEGLDWLKRLNRHQLCEALRQAYFASERNDGALERRDHAGVHYSAQALGEDRFELHIRHEDGLSLRLRGKTFTFIEGDGNSNWFLLSEVAVGRSADFRVLERALPSSPGFSFIVDTALASKSSS